jgi:hypothetical protein
VTDLRLRSRAGFATGVLLALLLLAPLLGPGYVLVRDMAFVPRTPLGGQLLGLDGVPRGVPSELVIALLSRVVATGWLQDFVLVALVVGAAWGAARLAPVQGVVPAAAAAATYGWSPYLHERLLLGQWALLVGWAVLPWAAAAALAWRRDGSAGPVVAWLAVAALAGANALLLVALVVVICGRPRPALLATAVLSLPWAVPAVLQDQRAGDPAGVDAFAAHADTPLGVFGSLLTGGGVWAKEAAPPGRSVGVWVALGVLIVALVGLRQVRRALGNRLVAAGAVGLLLALLGNLPGLHAALRWAVVHVPAAGLLRDGQKWVAPLLLLVSAAVGCGVSVVADRVGPAAGVLLAAAPLAALPGAAWGESGALKVSHYPSAWEQVTARTHGPVLVLPWTLYRAFPWEHDVPVLDPATKLLSRPVVDDDLPLAGRVVQGEDPLAARLDSVVTAGGPLAGDLAQAGVAQVLVEATTRGFDAVLTAQQTAGLTLVVSTPELALYDVPNSSPAAARTPPWAVLPGDVLALGLGLWGLSGSVSQAPRRTRRRFVPR